jgi:hypothetical protein
MDTSIPALEVLRPTEDGVASVWSLDARAAVLTSVLESARDVSGVDRRLTRAHPRRRARAMSLVAATVAFVLVGVLLPGYHPNSANALAALVRQASTFDQNVGPGQYLYQELHAEQPPSAGQPVETTTNSWTSTQGYVWQKQVMRLDGQPTLTDYYTFKLSDTDPLEEPSPEAIALLPSTPQALEAAFRRTVTSSTDKQLDTPDVQIFRGAAGLLTSTGFASTAQRHAALQMLSTLPGVKVTPRTHDSDGRAAVELSIADTVDGAINSYSVLFDPSTSAVLEQRVGVNNEIAFITVRDVTVTSTVPAAVVAGVRVWMRTLKAGMTPAQRAAWPTPRTK